MHFLTEAYNMLLCPLLHNNTCHLFMNLPSRSAWQSGTFTDISMYFREADWQERTPFRYTIILQWYGFPMYSVQRFQLISIHALLPSLNIYVSISFHAHVPTIDFCCTNHKIVWVIIINLSQLSNPNVFAIYVLVHGHIRNCGLRLWPHLGLNFFVHHKRNAWPFRWPLKP